MSPKGRHARKWGGTKIQLIVRDGEGRVVGEYSNENEAGEMRKKVFK